MFADLPHLKKVFIDPLIILRDEKDGIYFELNNSDPSILHKFNMRVNAPMKEEEIIDFLEKNDHPFSEWAIINPTPAIELALEVIK